MNAERWQQIESIFQSALALKGGEERKEDESRKLCRKAAVAGRLNLPEIASLSAATEWMVGEEHYLST